MRIATLIPVVLAAAVLQRPSLADDPMWVPPGFTSAGLDSGLTRELDFTKNQLLVPLTTHPRPMWACTISKMPSDPPGQWTLTFSIRRLTGFGNPGFSGNVIAKWNPASATPLTLTHQADRVNDAFIDYSLNLEPITTDASGARTGGRYAVFDRFNLGSSGLEHVGVFLAARTDDQSAFGEAAPVTGIVNTGEFVDPVLGHVDGQLKLFYVASAVGTKGFIVRGILMDDLLGVDTGAPFVAGSPVLVSEPSSAVSASSSWYSHSPLVISGANGDVQGLFVAEGDGADRSDVYFTPDLDPATPQLRAITNTDWLHSGGVAGGLVMHAKGDSPDMPWISNCAWLIGDEVAPGEVAEVRVAAYSDPSGPPAQTLVYMGSGWLSSPATYPGAAGQLGIAPLVTLGTRRVADGDQFATHRLAVPAIPALSGLDIPIQGLSVHVDATGVTLLTFTNTATIRIR